MKIIIACILSFAVSAITGKFLVPELRKLKAGQSIREDGPTWHAGKAGTPTMGVLMFILGIFVSILICGWKGMMAGDFEHLYIFFFALIFGGIGFLDDFEKVKHKQNLGLTAIQKFLLQLAAAVAFLCLMRFEGMLTPNLYVPFFNTQIVMSWWVYMVFAAFVIVGTVNAVNITDGVDGFVYKDDDPDQLAKVLQHAILHPEQLAAMKADCRKMYEKYYSNEAYVATLTRLVNESTD